MRDEQEREAMLPLQVLKEGHDLRLYGNVEWRNGLVGDDQFGVDGYAAGDGDALALPAGDLGRKLVAVAGVQPDKREQFVHFGPQPDLTGINTIDNQGLRNDVGNLHARIQGRRRVLEDDLHIAGIDAHNGARHRRLAAAGFPDQPEDFPLSQVERNPVDGVHRQGLVDGKMLLVVSDG